MLRAAADPTAEGPSVDVVVCVHDALEDVRRCLWSLSHKASYPFRLILVNDGSDEQTSAFLRSTAIANPTITLIENQTPPHGYTIAANLGMREAGADYVVLLNSDTIVTHGWLERIVACGESDERIGILGPLSNAASHQSIPELREGDSWATNPLPDFVTEDGMAKLLERVSPRSRPRLPFINGFCYVVKRGVFERIGYFDEENFASGYCEENDFSFRAAGAGFELAVADDAYVFHAKSKSFTPEARKPIAARNYEIFLEKHGAERIRSRVRELEEDTSLKPLRNAIAEGLSSARDLAGTLDLASHDPLDVTFILPGLGVGGSGGSHSVYQEVKGMREFGISARVMLPEQVFDRAEAAYGDAREVFIPFSDIDDLARKTARRRRDLGDPLQVGGDARRAARAPRRFPRPPITCRTTSPSSPPRTRPTSRRRSTPTPRSRTASCSRRPTGSATSSATATTCTSPRWSRASTSASTGSTTFPAGRDRCEWWRWSGPALPAASRPRRSLCSKSCGSASADEVELVTFGCSADEMVRLTSSAPLLDNHQGILTRHEVADLLNRCDVFLDMSMYQAFGRTALEAMACACTAVVPRHRRCLGVRRG